MMLLTGIDMDDSILKSGIGELLDKCIMPVEDINAWILAFARCAQWYWRS